MLLGFKTNKKYFIAGIIVAVCVVALLSPNLTQADPGENISRGLATAFSYFLHSILWVEGVLLGVVGLILDNVISGFTEFAPEGVRAGWTAVRDLVNMMFILVLLVVAFATVLNIDAYNVKNILPRLVIVALLINFSLPIGKVIVDSSEILMFGFYRAISEGAEGECKINSKSGPGVCLSRLALIVKVLEPANENNNTWSLMEKEDPWQIVGNLILSVIFILIFIVVVGAGAILMTIRVVAIWIALVLSPFAFFSHILPASQRFSKIWWTKFLQYSFFGPIYVFFLWISLILLTHTPSLFSTQEGFEGGVGKYTDLPGVSTFFQFIGNVLQFILVVVMLLWAFLATRKLGIYGAERIVGNAETFLKGFAWAVDRWAARGAHIPILGAIPGVNRLTSPARYLSYGAWKRAWDDRRKRVEGSYGKPAGAIEDKLEMLFNPLGTLADYAKGAPRKNFYEQLRHQSDVGDREHKIAAAFKDEDQLVSFGMGASDEVDKEAALRRMAATNALNTFFARMGRRFNAEEFSKYMNEQFGAVEGARIAADLTASAIGAGNYGLAGVTQYDPDTRRLRFGTEAERERAVRAKIREIEPQRFMAGLHPDSIFERDETGGYGNVHHAGDVLLDNLTQMHVDQFNRMQSRTQVEMARKIAQIRARNERAANAILRWLFPPLDPAVPNGPVLRYGGADYTLAQLQSGHNDNVIIDYINHTY